MDFTRWRDGWDPTQSSPRTVTIFGCGGIGSPLAISLAKFGVHRLNLIDYDRVEAHNLPNQAFGIDQKGELKCEALASLVSQFGVTEPRAFNSKLTPDGWDGDYRMSMLSGIVVSGPDNMEARKLLAEECMISPGVSHIVDPRIAGEYIRLEVCDLSSESSREAYKETLYSDEDAMDAPCTRQSVIWVAGFVAAFTARVIGRILSGEDVEEQLAFSAESLFLMAGDRPSQDQVAA